MQEGHLIANLSKVLSPRHQSLSTYEKELMVIILAVEKWRLCLLERNFVIKIDHFSLKYILKQEIAAPFQRKWLPKLIDFDHEIVYK